MMPYPTRPSKAATLPSGIVGASCVVVAALAVNERRRRAARKGVESGSALLAAAP